MSRRAIVMSSLAIFCCLLSVPASAITFNAFMDVIFEDSSRTEDDSGFKLGQLVLWGSHVIDEERKLKTFIELVVEESAFDGFKIEPERLWVEYTANQQLRLRAGRFHTALGYWNRTFHHGAHMQTSVARPLFLGFEDEDLAVLPSHTVGMMALIDFKPAAGDLHIEFQFGNGSYYDGTQLRPGNTGDVDNNRSVATRLVYSPDFLQGLGLGLSYYSSTVSEDIGAGNIIKLVDQAILGSEVSYKENNTEIILEYFTIDNEDVTGISRTSNAWYAHVAYTVSDRWTPYIRYESLDNVDLNDPYFIRLGTFKYRHTVYGARYELADNSSLKLEGMHMEIPASIEGSVDRYLVQWTFAF